MTRPFPLLLLFSLPLASLADSHVAKAALPAPHTEKRSSTDGDDTAQRGRVAGRVTTQAGQPLEGVTVALKGTVFGSNTDAQGNFRFAAPAGAYQLVISNIGYGTTEQAVQIIAGETLTLPAVALTVTDQQLAEVTVTGTQTINQRPVSIGKLAIAPLDLPQSTLTIERQVLEQQQVLRVSDVLANVSGVYIMGTTGGTQEEIAGRGFAFGSSNTFKNGVRYNNGIMPETSSLERFEVLKGSNAILFGNVAAGGVLNLVTKKPLFEKGGSVALRAGSFGLYKPMVDLYTPIGKNVAVRVNGSAERNNSFRDEVEGKRYYVNPSVLVKAGQNTEVLLEGDYLYDQRTPDFGIGAINYEIADVPRSTFLNTSWARNRTKQASSTLTITQHLSDDWQLRGVGAFQQYDNTQRSANRPTTIRDRVPHGAIKGSEELYGNWVRGAQQSATKEDYFLGQLDLTGKLRTGFAQHALLVGMDADKYNTASTAYATLAVYDSINVFDVNKFGQRQDVSELTRNTRTYSPIRRVGAYVQDLISLGEKVKLLAGVRYSYQETGSFVYNYAKAAETSRTKRFDDAFTPRLGLVYQPLKTLSIFGSYANSFNTNSGIDNTGAALPPSLIDQYEVGVKNELFKGLLSANVTAYRIVNSNLAQTIQPNASNFNSNIPTAQELAGEVTSRGVELDVQSKPMNGWSFITGYSYNRTTYTKSNIYTEGSLLRYNPAHTANGTVFYTFQQQSALQGLQLGMTAFYVGERQAGRSTRNTVANDLFRLIPLPAYTQLDASVGYTYQRASLRLKLSNLLNELSYNVHDDNSVNPIAPRNFSATLSYKL